MQDTLVQTDPLRSCGREEYEFVRGEGMGGWVRAGMKESVEGERVRAGKKIKFAS